MARRLGGSGGIARVALETMRSAYRELPGMATTPRAALGDVITQFVHLSMLDLAGHRHRDDAARGAARAHQAARDARIWATRDCRSTSIAHALNLQPAPPVQRLRRRARRRGRLHPARGASRPAAPPSTTRGNADRSITDIALALGFSNLAHFSRVFRTHLGVSPSDYRQARLHA